MLQTIKRNRDFNPDERDALYEMIENNREREDCLVGAYLLLGQTESERHFARLSEAEQQIFQEISNILFLGWRKDKWTKNENADSQ